MLHPSAFVAGAGMTVLLLVSAHAQAPIPPAPRTTTSVASPQAPVASSMDTPDGVRVSKIIGAVVYNDDNGQIGSIDDLVVRLDGKVSVAILSVGGFLGIGTKLVSVPYSDIRTVNGKVALPAATKDSLTALPAYSYTP